MANMIKIKLRTEQDATVINGAIVTTDNWEGYQVYACCDELSCWIGDCSDIESLEYLAGPEELIDSITKSASEYELECLMAVLECNDYQYDYFNEIRIAKVE